MRAKAIFTFMFLLISAIGGGATTYKTLHNFDYDAADSPYAGLIFDHAGNLYGATAYGGGDYEDGVIFKLSPSPSGWTYRSLHEFDLYDPVGREPIGGLTIDEAGNIYGTNSYDDVWECGTVFTSSGWVPIHAFTGPDGCIPQANLRYDGSGWLVGTTSKGGTYGQGTLFFVSVSGDTFRSYSFQGTQGTSPLGGFNSFGYGTTASGGRKAQGNVYWLSPEGLVGKHNFKLDGQAGYGPRGELLTASVGGVRTMYGTTSAGGMGDGGTVYRLTENPLKPDHWLLTTMHTFRGADGLSPRAGLTSDAAGNLYGTTSQGGDWGCGTVFKLSPKPKGGWKYTVLYSFNPYNEDSGGDGCSPNSGVVIDAAGNLYGTTLTGGWYDMGTVYEIMP